MTNEQILKQAIEKAVKNGWKYEGQDEGAWTFDEFIKMISKDYYDIIFSHDFAEAFWGEEWPKEMEINGNFPYWKMELTQMVLEKEPLQYLKKFL